MSSMINPGTTETSVTFSLVELARIEQERVREENLQRTQAREMEARARREAEERRRAEDAARAAAEAEARAQQEHEAAAERARVEGQEQAAIVVARIEAEAKARLAADTAARAHELEVLRLRTEGGHRRLQRALAAALGLVLCGGCAAAYGVSQHVADLRQEAAELRDGQQALARERDQAREIELSALDRRYAALRARRLLRGAEEALATAEAARSTLRATGGPSLDHDRLRVFNDALDGLEARIQALEKLAALDQRHADLAAWAAARRRTEATAAVQAAAARAKATGDQSALHAYETALDELRNGLARSISGSDRRTHDPEIQGTTCSDPHDPMCGLNGHAL